MTDSKKNELDMENILHSMSGSYSAELKAKMDRLDRLLGQKHWASVGDYKEEIFRKQLRDRLPSRYSVGSGFVCGRAGEHRLLSRQIDVLVWDSQEHIPLFRDGSFVIIPPEACRAAIEIKKTLKRTETWKSLRNLDSLTLFRQYRGLVKPDYTIYKAIFAYSIYDGYNFPEDVWDDYDSFYRNCPNWSMSERLQFSKNCHLQQNQTFPWVNSIGILDQGVMVLSSWGINRKSVLTLPAYRSNNEGIDDTYGVIERDLLIRTLAPQGSKQILAMDRPGTASALFLKPPDFYDPSFLALDAITNPISTIGSMSDENASELASKIYSANNIAPPSKFRFDQHLKT